MGRSDGVFERLERAEARPIVVDHRAGEGGHRADAATNKDAPCPCGAVEGADAGHEIPPIGEIEIVAALGDAGLRHPGVLALKRSRGMDDNVGAERRQDIAEWLGNIQPHRLGRLGRLEAFRQGRCLPSIATGEEEANFGLSRQQRGDGTAEIAVGADDQDPLQAWQLRYPGLTTISQ